ncbi:MAG: T9SS type A sorting domain-containing protein [Saprospiraceae bacterium]|nr:T9SS type A sorting domain-containing protein [Saprospiraceae bacterium]
MRGVIRIFGIILSLFAASAQAQKINFDWAKSFGGDDFEASRFMKVDTQGNVYLSGETSSTYFKVDGKYLFNNSINNVTKAYLFKYSNSGELLWSKLLFNDIGVEVLGLDIDIDQNIILTGFYYGSFLNVDSLKLKRTDIFNSNIFIIKLTPTGSIINHKICSALSTITSFGGLTHDSKNHYYLAGATDGNMFDQNSDTIFKRDRKDGNILLLMKMDSQLNIQWIKSFGGKGDQIFDVFCDQEDNLIVYGCYRFRTLSIDSLMVNNYTNHYGPGPGYGDHELFISKLDLSGKALWLKTISGAKVEFPSYNDITLDNEGNIYLGGIFQSDTLFINENVKLIRTKNALDYFDLFYAKFDKNGDCKWAKKIINGNDLIDDMSIHLLKNGNLIITGNYDSTAFKTGPVILPNNGHGDCFVLLSNNEGEILSGTSFGGEGLEWDQQIASYDTSIYIFAGFTSKELKIRDEVLVDETSIGDGLFIKLHIDSLTSLIEFKPASQNIMVYPNPVQDVLHFQYPKNESNLRYIIYDMYGRSVNSGTLYRSTRVINVELIKAGVYFLYVLGEQGRSYNCKFVKM